MSKAMTDPTPLVGKDLESVREAAQCALAYSAWRLFGCSDGYGIPSRELDVDELAACHDLTLACAYLREPGCPSGQTLGPEHRAALDAGIRRFIEWETPDELRDLDEETSWRQERATRAAQAVAILERGAARGEM